MISDDSRTRWDPIGCVIWRWLRQSRLFPMSSKVATAILFDVSLNGIIGLCSSISCWPPRLSANWRHACFDCLTKFFGIFYGQGLKNRLHVDTVGARGPRRVITTLKHMCLKDGFYPTEEGFGIPKMCSKPLGALRGFWAFKWALVALRLRATITSKLLTTYWLHSLAKCTSPNTICNIQKR